MAKVLTGSVSWPAVAVAALILAASPAAFATPILFTSTSLSTGNGLFAPTTTSSSATTRSSDSQLDANNFAQARADAAAGSVGIGLATNLPDGSNVSGDAAAREGEFWNPGCAFPVLCAGIIRDSDVTVNVHFAGTLTKDWLAANSLSGESKSVDGSLDIGTASMSFSWNGSQMAGSLCGISTCSPFTLAMTTAADGSLVFSDDLSFVILESTGSPFSSTLTLSAGGDGTFQPSALSFLDTLHFDIVSNDPDFIWTSDSGRTSQAAESTAVPEPGTLALLVTGLVPLILMHRCRAV